MTAQGGFYLHKTIADVTTTHLGFPGGEQAHVFVSWLHPFKEQKLVVIGDRAMAVFDDGQGWERQAAALPAPHRMARDAAGADARRGRPGALGRRRAAAGSNAGISSIASRPANAPRTDGQEGLRVLRVLARASAALQRLLRPRLRDRAEPSSSRFPGVQIHESAYVDEPCEIGAGTRIWHFVHVLPRTRIGSDCSLGQNVMVGPDVTVGDGCKIQNNVSIYKGVTLEDGVFCGPSCVFTNVNNPRAEIERKDEFRPTLVKRGATIGANATIVCGHTVGEYAFIAAGAVVTQDVPAFALMAGVPARRIGWMSHAGERLGADLVCPPLRPPLPRGRPRPDRGDRLMSDAVPALSGSAAPDRVHRPPGASAARIGSADGRGDPARRRSRPLHPRPRGRRTGAPARRVLRRQARAELRQRHRRVGAGGDGQGARAGPGGAGAVLHLCRDRRGRRLVRRDPGLRRCRCTTPSTSIRRAWRPASPTARRLGLEPVGVIPVDLFGLPADYDAILAIAAAHRPVGLLRRGAELRRRLQGPRGRHHRRHHDDELLPGQAARLLRRWRRGIPRRRRDDSDVEQPARARPGHRQIRQRADRHERPPRHDCRRRCCSKS